MVKDLTNSNIDRQNILNNRYAITSIQEYIGSLVCRFMRLTPHTVTFSLYSKEFQG